MKFWAKALLILGLLLHGGANAGPRHGIVSVPPNQIIVSITDSRFAGGAVCDGVTNDAAKFVAFSDWAIANQGSSQIVLDLPTNATCIMEPTSGQAFWLQGIVNNGAPPGIASVATGGTCSGGGNTCVRLAIASTADLVSGRSVDVAGLTGTPLANGIQTFTIADATHIDLPNVTFVASTVDNLPRIYPQWGVSNLIVRGNGGTIKNTTAQGIQTGPGGLIQDNRHYGNTATVSAGSNSITLLVPAKAALFAVGSYAVMTGLDIQGIWFSAYGFPPNPHFNEFVQIASANTTTGVVTFTAPLVNSYKSTWPSWSNGSLFEVYTGGPATLYSLPAAWNASIEYQNLTFDQANQQSASGGKSITWRNSTMTGAHCSPPSQNLTWSFIGSTGISCSLEADKMIHEVVVTNSTIRTLKFQSSSIDLLTMSGSTITQDLTGTPKAANISSSVISSTYNASTNPNAAFHPGAYAYGVSTGAITCTACDIRHMVEGAYQEPGTDGAVGVNNMMTMVGGLITMPNGVNISAMVDNGSGKPRVTVSSTSGWTTGQSINIGGISGTGGCFAVVPATCGNGGNQIITVVDSQHFDLTSQTWTIGSTYGSGGLIGNVSPRWAIPGSYNYWLGGANVGGIFKVLDQSFDATHIYIQTDQAGGFPTFPNVSGKLTIIPLATPSMSCSGCFGSTEALDLAASFAQGLPIYSAISRTFTGATGTTQQPVMKLYGNADTIHMKVTNAYVGAGSVSFLLSLFDNWSLLKSDNTVVSYAGKVNAKSVGDRQIQLSGVTCPSGTCTGDSGLALPDATKSWFQGVAFSGPDWSNDVSASCPGANCPAVTLTMKTNQGVVYP